MINLFQVQSIYKTHKCVRIQNLAQNSGMAFYFPLINCWNCSYSSLSLKLPQRTMFHWGCTLDPQDSQRLGTTTAEYWRLPLKTLLTAHFNSLNTKYALVCINMHKSSSSLICLCSWGYSQSAQRKMNGALGLAALQIPANSMWSNIAPEYFSFPSWD